MPIRPSSVVGVNFSLKILISQKRPDTFRKVPSEGTHVLYKYGFGWIIIKVILKDQIWLIFNLEAILTNYDKGMLPGFFRPF